MAQLAPLALTVAALAVAAPNSSGPEPVPAGVSLHYGPSPLTAQADLAALASAKKSIDMAAFVLTDRDVIAALTGAAARGVAIRVYLDGDEMEHAGSKALTEVAAMAAMKNVAIRAKARHSESMHLKAYVVDSRLLRTGSANFSYSGERFQDNDVVMLASPTLAASFVKAFELMWTRPDNEAYPR